MTKLAFQKGDILPDLYEFFVNKSGKVRVGVFTYISLSKQAKYLIFSNVLLKNSAESRSLVH
ncbi:hypothetical protein BH09BAC4_BH09BAC4_42570 [soil metagenome]